MIQRIGEAHETDKQAVVAKLNSVCWNFPASETRNGLHSIHPYPAKFIPEIPRALIALFHPGDDSAVFDPFCGSGTTLIEASNRGLPAIGVDLNPLATLIAKVKTTPLQNIESPGNDVLSRAKRKVVTEKVAAPSIPNLDHWFQRPVQEALAALISEIESVPHADNRDALKIAFSSIVVRVSNQDSDTRYAAVEKNITQEDVWTGFRRAVTNIGRALSSSSSYSLFPVQRRVRILNADITRVQPEEIGQDIGLVITSPPYPNAYEYWLYHKYRMFWLGMNPVEVKEKEIGARAHYFKKNHHTEDDFERQMGRCFQLLSQIMRRGAYACFVVGRSIIHGREIDNAALLERAAARQGFCRMGEVSREIAAARKSFNLHHARIKREGIVVFRLEES